MKPWSAFYPYVLPHLPDAVLPVVDFHLREAAQEWCEKTLCWREWLDPAQTTGTDVVFDFGASQGQSVVQLVNATLAGTKIDVLRIGDVPADWRTTSGCAPAVFGLANRTQFAVIPLQAADIEIATEVALKPSNTAAGVGDDVFEQYARQIAAGALAAMVPDMARATQFRDAIAETASDVFHSFSPAPARVRASFM